MEVVANHLMHEVFTKTDNAEKDFFGRSSFNRYYYSMFLQVKSTLSTLEPKWEKLPHKDYPSVIRTKVTKMLKHKMAQAKKLEDKEVISVCSKGLSAARELAKIMESSYSVRVAADYKIGEMPLRFNGTRSFTLNNTSIDEMKNWNYKVNMYLISLSKALLEIK